jgi:SAM-dependent methyltransferase
MPASAPIDRVLNPEAMIADLVRRAQVSQRGRLLDLACGTGQLAFPLRRWFSEVWAVDQEPDMVEVVRAKAAAMGAGDVRPDSQVLSDAGFEAAGRHEFTTGHRWNLPELAGYIRSTSVLPAAVLGDQAAAFDADLAASLGPHGDRGAFTETVSFAYERLLAAGRPARGCLTCVCGAQCLARRRGGNGAD